MEPRDEIFLGRAKSVEKKWQTPRKKKLGTFGDVE
jgi:hypothetical protein